MTPTPEEKELANYKHNCEKLARFIADLSSALCHIGPATKEERYDAARRLLAKGMAP